MSDEAKLKECPRCNFTPNATALSDSDQRIYGYRVHCCGISTPMMNRRKAAIAAWNTRVKPQEPRCK